MAAEVTIIARRTRTTTSSRVSPVSFPALPAARTICTRIQIQPVGLTRYHLPDRFQASVVLPSVPDEEEAISSRIQGAALKDSKVYPVDCREAYRPRMVASRRIDSTLLARLHRGEDQEEIPIASEDREEDPEVSAAHLEEASSNRKTLSGGKKRKREREKHTRRRDDARIHTHTHSTKNSARRFVDIIERKRKTCTRYTDKILHLALSLSRQKLKIFSLFQRSGNRKKTALNI